MPERIHLLGNPDYEILCDLGQNLRADAAKIARATGANEQTVRKRIARLIDTEAVSLAPVVDPQASSYATLAQVFLEVDPAHEEEVIETFLGMPAVAYLACGEGPRDFSTQAFFRDNG